MSTKQKTGPLEDLLDLVALLPWWAGVAIAIIGYFALHRIAKPVQAAGIQPGQIASFVVPTIIAGLAMAGQYIALMVGFVWRHDFTHSPQTTHGIDQRRGPG